MPPSPTGKRFSAAPPLPEPPPRIHVLVVDDDEDICKLVSRSLAHFDDMSVEATSDTRDLVARIATAAPDVVLLDVMMPGVNGLDVLRELMDRGVGCQVVMMTAVDSVDLVVEAVKLGAQQFLVKPFATMEAVHVALLKAAEHGHLVDRSRSLEARLEAHERFGEIVGRSPPMRALFDMIERVAEAPSSVLVLGESGTGKELVARAIHNRSPRATRPFVAVNCGAIPADLVESELFGHVRGAFTGAQRDRAGLFETANGGTLLLDEVGDLPPAVQVKLLRALQERETRRVGTDVVTPVDVRVVAATNVDLESRVKAGSFRSDLFYRLNVIALRLPSLRDRLEDVPLLVEHFVTKCANRLQKPRPQVDADAMRALVEYDWPGNVRELEHVIERALVLCRGGFIERQDISIAGPSPLRAEEGPASLNGTYTEARKELLHDFDRRYATGLLDATGGNVSQAARLAGLDRTNFRRLMKRVGIRPR
jgi:DNA-binding NtrC family response regulator